MSTTSTSTCLAPVDNHGRRVDWRAQGQRDRTTRGIQQAAEHDPTTGLLVSMHGAGLYNDRYGTFRLAEQLVSDSERALVDEFLAEQALFQRLAVFVDGCFWHACPKCADGTRKIKSNTAYWSSKLASNAKRDASHQEALLAAGWKLLILWQCDIEKSATFDWIVELIERISPSN